MKNFKDEMRKQSMEMNIKWGELVNKMGTLEYLQAYISMKVLSLMQRKMVSMFLEDVQ